MPENVDEFYMRRALALAERAWGDTSPNPMVGAVLVKNGEIVGEGWHRRDGFPHAEIECLRSAKTSPKGATIYVTLEPCSTHGRTGACTEALLKAGVACVKIGALDPNPVHAGRAVEIFRAANVACEYGILERECTELNFIFNFAIVNKKPLVALKCAVSADGKITAKRGVHTGITEDAARADMMKWRRLFSSIAVGRGTLEADNPSLTARGLPDGDHCAERQIFDASLNIARLENPQKFSVFSDAFAEKTRVVCDAAAPKDAEDKLNSLGISTMRIGERAENAAAFWDELKERLYAERITSLYVEGGSLLWDSLCKARAADFAFEYDSPKVLGADALDAFPRGRPFDIDGRETALAPDKLKFGKIVWKPTK